MFVNSPMGCGWNVHTSTKLHVKAAVPKITTKDTLDSATLTGQSKLNSGVSTSIIASLLAKDVEHKTSVLEGESNASVEDGLDELKARYSDATNITQYEMHAKELHEKVDNVESSDQVPYLESVDLDNPRSVVNVSRSKNPEIVMYGGPDPKVPISSVPCPGCGAFLHCQDPGIPGYMPSQKFLAIPPASLRDNFCQRCHLMRNHNLALQAAVSHEDYKRIIGEIKQVRALAVLVVDMTDVSNSILPDLPALIGRKRPLYIVGNKVDLLPKDGKGYLNRVLETLVKSCRDVGLYDDMLVKETVLVSAKTGYGIEELVTKLMVEWSRKGKAIVDCRWRKFINSIPAMRIIIYNMWYHIQHVKAVCMCICSAVSRSVETYRFMISSNILAQSNATNHAVLLVLLLIIFQIFW